MDLGFSTTFYTRCKEGWEYTPRVSKLPRLPECLQRFLDIVSKMFLVLTSQMEYYDFNKTKRLRGECLEYYSLMTITVDLVVKGEITRKGFTLILQVGTSI